MDLQIMLVIAIIAAAIVYAGTSVLRKRKAFSTKPGCEADCGCSGGSKKLPS